MLVSDKACWSCISLLLWVSDDFNITPKLVIITLCFTRFVAKTSETDYVSIESGGSGCYAYVGYECDFYISKYS